MVPLRRTLLTFALAWAIVPSTKSFHLSIPRRASLSLSFMHVICLLPLEPWKLAWLRHGIFFFSFLCACVVCVCACRHIVFEAKVLKENVGAATKLLGELVSGKPGDVAASKAAMLATLEAANASPEEVRQVCFQCERGNIFSLRCALLPLPSWF